MEGAKLCTASGQGYIDLPWPCDTLVKQACRQEVMAAQGDLTAPGAALA